MALTVGNVITDPSAQSFISVADADAYLAPENIAAWNDLSEPEKEAALTQSSRWIAYTFTWCDPDGMTDADLQLLGFAAARLAAYSLGTDFWASGDSRGNLTRAKADTVEVQWAGRTGPDYSAAGKYWPWLERMLSRLICDPSGYPLGIGVLVV